MSTDEDVLAQETSLEQDSMVSFNRSELKQLGLVNTEGKKDRLSEEFRLIKRPLIKNAFGKGASQVDNARIIMMTSAMPGEGKTFTALNLAVSMALEKDKKVLLLDADVLKPKASRILGMDEQPGLIDCLFEDIDSPLALQHQSDVPNLSFLPAGRQDPNATELLASQRMEWIMNELANHNPDRIILVDSPPLLVTSEASVLTGLVGQIVMVVEANRTPQSLIKEALSRVEFVEIVGFVLNKTHYSSRSKSYYGGYYGYGGYGYGYGYGQEKK